MARSRSSRHAAVRCLGLAFAFSGLVPSCSLRDISALDSGPESAGQPGAGESSGGSADSRAGAPASAGSEPSGSAGDSAEGGKLQAPGAGGEAGEAAGGEGGSGGGVEPAPVGTFANCPARSTWSIDSNPPLSDLMTVETKLGIDETQLYPAYAIDDADSSGTSTRFSSGRPAQGDERLTVDLGVDKWISGVYTKEASSDFGRKFEIWVSRDNTMYTKVATQDGVNGAFDIEFQPVVARFVRLSQVGTSDKWWSLHDYKIYCTADAVPDASGAGGGSSAGGTAGTSGKAGAGG